MEINLQIGPALRADGDVEDRLRVSRQGGLVCVDGHGKYYEEASRGWIYSLIGSLTGSTIAAGNVAPPVAAAAVLLAIANPPASGVNLEILRAFLGHISGTPGAGMWAYCMAPYAGLSLAANATPRGHLNGAPGAKAQCYFQVALTGGSAFASVRPLPTAQFAGAIAATTPGQIVKDDVEGDLVVPPGYVLCLAPPAVGTTHIVTPGLTWAEVPVQTAG